LLEDQYSPPDEPGGKALDEFRHRAVDLGVGAPAQALGGEQHFLGAHPPDHLGMCRHPDAAAGDRAQQGIQLGAVRTVLHRIHPDQHPIQAQQLVLNCLQGVVEVHDGFDGHIDLGKGLSQRREHGVGPCRLPACVPVTARQQPNPRLHATHC
jgi:hypothetical protein